MVRFCFPLLFVFFLGNFIVSTKPEASSGEAILKDFSKWLEDHGSKCRCHFIFDKRESGPNIMAMADRRIHDRESIFMLPESLIINPTVIESSPLGPSLDMVSLVEDIISKEANPTRQAVMYIAQLTLFVLHGLQTKDNQWLPYFNQLMHDKRCNLLWAWDDKELEALQDAALTKRAKNWRLEVHMLTSNIVPKLLQTGAFPGGLEVDKLENAMCIVQSKSFNMTNGKEESVRSLVPGRELFPYDPAVPSAWWSKNGALRYRYANKEIEHGDAIFSNLDPKGDSVQTLLDFGVFETEGSKFITTLPRLESKAKRDLMEKMKIKNAIKYSDRFTFKSAALPYFRIEALSDSEVNDLLTEISQGEDKLQAVKFVFRSPMLYTKTYEHYSCKSEVIALNTLSVHLRDEMSGMDSSIMADEKILKKGGLSPRLAIAVEYRLKFKKLVTHALDITSARAIDTKRKCLSGEEL